MLCRTQDMGASLFGDCGGRLSGIFDRECAGDGPWPKPLVGAAAATILSENTYRLREDTNLHKRRKRIDASSCGRPRSFRHDEWDEEACFAVSNEPCAMCNQIAQTLLLKCKLRSRPTNTRRATPNQAQTGEAARERTVGFSFGRLRKN